MYKKLLFLILVFWVCLAQKMSAQNIVTFNVMTAQGDLLQLPIDTSSSAFKNDTVSIPEVVSKIIDCTGLNKNFQCRSLTELTTTDCGQKYIDTLKKRLKKNAAATIIKKKRYILYDEDWLKSIKSSSGENWFIYFAVSHEIGHHLNWHLFDTISSTLIMKELEADSFAGFILFDLGATLNDINNLIPNFRGNDSVDSKTHPSKRKRLNAITGGWNNAKIFNMLQKPDIILFLNYSFYDAKISINYELPIFAKDTLLPNNTHGKWLKFKQYASLNKNIVQIDNGYETCTMTLPILTENFIQFIQTCEQK
jgi:hypothetical protein